MGMFDEIMCKVSLPVKLDVDHRNHWFQTKSLGSRLQFYEIQEDGSLWRFIDEGLLEKTWIECPLFIGEIRFYTQKSCICVKDTGQHVTGWLEFSALFVDGRLRSLELIEDRDGPLAHRA